MEMKEFHSMENKRVKLSTIDEEFNVHDGSSASRDKDSKGACKVRNYSDPFEVPDLLAALDEQIYGSFTSEIEALFRRNLDLVGPIFAKYPTLLDDYHGQTTSELAHLQGTSMDLQDDCVAPVIIIDSDDDDIAEAPPARYYHDIILPPRPEFILPPKPTQALATKDIPYNFDPLVRDAVLTSLKQEVTFPSDTNVEKDKGVYVGVEEDDSDETEIEDDGLGDVWNEMALALEVDKGVDDPMDEEYMQEDGDCDHSFLLKDDIGYVCRVCGVIGRGIETIIDLQFIKAKKSTRTYAPDFYDKDRGSNSIGEIRFSDTEFTVAGISAHPRHKKEMKPHQVEGFNFLCSNLVSENPGGCIMAHAPGSGKTFMIISFVQSFLAKYPHARPLVVLPKGILSTWKREFDKWQVEDLPLYDFYSVKANERHQQLEVLKQWKDSKSILFLGYKQFTNIVCKDGTSEASAACQDILAKAPSLLILDEGHTPRNENTEVFEAVGKVQTPRKVILSGTLFQNHVKEVFNILNLVRPMFLRLDTSKRIIRRIMSRGDIGDMRKNIKVGADVAFFDLIEHTLQKDKDFTRKVKVIGDLRDMTKNVLHYYKGDFLEELPGLHDFSVVLNLTPSQTVELEKRKKLWKINRGSLFRRNSLGSALYLHPALVSVSENQVQTADGNMKIDSMLTKIDIRAGTKAKFFLNLLNLCQTTNEKLLVFSQFLPPLKFLERLTVKEKNWALGVEIFVISGKINGEEREFCMDRFNNSADAKVLFGSIKACGEGISLVGASRILILDVHLNPSVTRQAIGRAFRPGQKKEVFSYRLVAAESPEEEDHSTCLRKEAIAKMWFEWNEYCGYRDFDVQTVNLEESCDPFMDSPVLRQDIKALYRRSGIENSLKTRER